MTKTNKPTPSQPKRKVPEARIGKYFRLRAITAEYIARAAFSAGISETDVIEQMFAERIEQEVPQTA
jgi:hypothetical protein